VLQTLNGETKKENVMQTPKIGTDEFMSLSPDRRLAEYYKEIASINEGIARLAVDMQHLSPDEREEVRLYLRRRSSEESTKQSGKITTVSELLSRLVQP
jgi:DNA-directed RNA polymerase subunit F